MLETLLRICEVADTFSQFVLILPLVYFAMHKFLQFFYLLLPLGVGRNLPVFSFSRLTKFSC